MLLGIILLTGSIITAKEETVKTNLSGVKVFLRGAELTHTAKVKLEKGIMDLIFTGLASNIDQNSINVSAKGDLVILSVVQRFDYMNPLGKNPQVKVLEDSLDLLNKKVLYKQNESDALKSEMDLLFANREIGSKDKGVSVVELQKMADYFRKKFTEIKNISTEISLDIKKTQKEIDRISKQLNELNAQLNKPTSQIVVTVSAKSANTAEFLLSYLTYDANWQPSYDIRVENINQPAKLNYKANVRQNSGLDWKDVNVILSTRNPVQSNNKPELYPWFIDFRQEMLYRELSKTAPHKVAAMQNIVAEDAAGSMADFFEVTQTQLSVEFVPTIKYTIPSDGKPHIVALQDYSIPASYEYYAAPKLDNNAFLVAILSKWNDLNLLPGQANIYFENSYVGQSFINPMISKDSLSISLGRDQGIVVNKNTLKDFTEDKFLSSDVERTFAYEIVVRNNKNIPVNILVEEQIPISKNEDIKVTLTNFSGGKFNENEGKLLWNIQVEASKSVTKKLVYSVRYPKDKTIDNL
jgi:uncharacterized protein (TIGR02231 family)